MIDNVTFGYKRGKLITFDKDGVKDSVPYSAVKKAWRDLTVDSIEGWRLKVVDNKIAFVILVSSGQGGTLFVWDTDCKELVHYSDASYCEDFLLLGNKVIMMCLVSNYVTPSHIQLWMSELLTKDQQDSGKRLYCETPVCFDKNNSLVNSMALKLKGKKLFVVVNDQAFLYSNDIDSIDKQQPNPEFGFLYQKWENQFDPEKNAMRGMLT